MAIVRPTLLLNEERARRNIAGMAAKARHHGLFFRPHFKTHQSAEIGEWFREQGVSAITVSSVAMARYFAENGWRDITVAFPVNIREIDAINALAETISLSLLVESEETVEYLDRHLHSRVDLWIKIDVGYHRTGISWDQPDRAVALVKRIARMKKARWQGLLTHAGHAYHAACPAEVLNIHRESLERMTAVKRAISDAGFPAVKISVGDTPTCSLADDFGGVDEIRPGNFVFYDVMQQQIGSCREGDIAVALAAPVVALHPERWQAVVHGGAVHLSKESLRDADGQTLYGKVARLTEDGWSRAIPGARVTSLSQEHGLISLPADELAGLKVGDLLAILPVHSCLTANLMKRYRTLSGRHISCLRE